MMHESGALRYMEEIWGPTSYQRRYGSILGNRGPKDGYRYRGRSPIMLTGRSNYATYGQKLGVDLVGRPDLAATPGIGWKIAARFWLDKGLNGVAERQDFREVTRLINGRATDAEPSHHLRRVEFLSKLDGQGVVPSDGGTYDAGAYPESDVDLILRKGDSGPLVLALQQELLKLGHQLPTYGADSDFGDETVAAVKAFQESAGFTGGDVDGEVGPKTRAALDKALKANR